MSGVIACGIDPGLDGAVVVIEDGELEFHDTPTVTVGTKRKLDSAKCSAILRKIQKDAEDSGKRLIVTIEKVGAIRIAGRQQGGVSMFSFGYGAGIWEGILAMGGISFQFISPQRWKGALMDGEAKDKDASRVVCRRLWPSQTEEALSRKKDHNRADACLLAEYGRRTTK